MTKFLSGVLFGAVVLLQAPPRVDAAEMDMILLPGEKAVKWNTAPPSLPPNVKISLIAGDPALAGPFTLRLRVPANTVLAPHTHAKLESVTVLSGKIYHEVGEKLDKAKGSLLVTGGFVSLPAEMAHSLWTTATTVIQVTGVGPFDLHYINPSDDPRNDPKDPRNKK